MRNLEHIVYWWNDGDEKKFKEESRDAVGASKKGMKIIVKL